MKKEMVGVCSTYRERCAYRVLAGKLEGKRPLISPRLRWEDNIKMYFQKVGWGSMDWIGLA